MAVRNESVRLSLDDQFTTGMAKAAAATAIFRKNLNDLDGTSLSTSRNLNTSTKSVDSLGSSSRRNGPEIDKLSGRLRLLRDAAIVLGPALVPLGAAIIPVLTGSIAALGAASGGIGAAILAFNGLGDAMDAIDEAQVEPTAENLQAMRVELEKLGPAGAHFARFLQDLGPEMTNLQMIAREGMFPGIEEGIDDLLTRLPLVEDVISRLSKGVGDLAAQAGADLASDDWTPFLEYVRTTGRPTLERFGESIGNVAQGLADMIVAFAPLTRDFSRGMLEMSESFADWASNLQDNQSFQDFVNYIRESGPQALELLGSLAETFVAIIEAAAPIGSVTLPIITALVKVIGAIADTPLGPAFIAAAAGLTAFNRAASITAPALARMPTSLAGVKAGLAGINGRQAAAGLGLVALAATDVDDKLGLSNTAMLGTAGLVGGPWGAAIGAGVGLTLDLAAANDSLKDSIDSANDAIERGSVEDMLKQRQAILDELAEQNPNLMNIGFDNAGDALRGLVNNFSGASDEARDKLAELNAALVESGPHVDVFGIKISTAAAHLLEAKAAAEDFTGAIAELSGWLDKREALRNYEEGLRGITKGLKDGFGRDDVENIDAVGRNIIQVAEQIKKPAIRARFLEGARSSLEDLARNAGPKARAEIQKLIDKIEEVGLTHAEPDIDVDTRQALSQLDHLLGVLNVFDGKVVTSRVVTIYERMNRGGGSNVGDTNQLFGGQAGGGTIPGPRHPYGDKMLYLLAPGEEVVSNRDGQADRWRPWLKAINANWAANGATAGGGSPRPLDFDPLGHAAQQAAQGLKGLQAQLKESERALDKERRQRDAVVDKMTQLSSDVASGLRSDIFAAPSNVWAPGMSVNATLSSDIARGREFIRLVKSLKSKGLDGPALAELLASGDVERARLYAAMSARDLRAYERLYETREAVLGHAGTVAGNAAFGGELVQANAELKAANKELREIKAAIKNAEKSAKHNSDDNADRVGDKINKGARAARRRALV